MAGVSRIWVSDREVEATNPDGLITGFTEATWFLLEVFQNQSVYTSQTSIGVGGIQYEPSVSYNTKNLNEATLKYTNELALSYGFGIVVEIDGQGLYPSSTGWSVQYDGSDREQRVVFSSTDGNRPRLLTPEFFERFTELEPAPNANIITINTEPVTIGAQDITIN